MPDGYPTDEELLRIREWSWEDPLGWFAYIKSVGNYWNTWHHWGWSEELDGEYHVFHISTGGWSGNEEIIRSMQRNAAWMFYWESTRRGGHYEFRVKQPQ